MVIPTVCRYAVYICTSTCDVERINTDGESSYYTDDMLEALGKAHQGDRIIIHASA